MLIKDHIIPEQGIFLERDDEIIFFFSSKWGFIFLIFAHRYRDTVTEQYVQRLCCF